MHVEMTKVLKTHRHATPILFRNSRVVPEQNSVPERTESIPEQASVPEQSVHSGTDARSGTSHSLMEHSLNLWNGRRDMEHPLNLWNRVDTRYIMNWEDASGSFGHSGGFARIVARWALH